MDNTKRLDDPEANSGDAAEGSRLDSARRDEDRVGILRQAFGRDLASGKFDPLHRPVDAVTRSRGVAQLHRQAARGRDVPARRAGARRVLRDPHAAGRSGCSSRRHEFDARGLPVVAAGTRARQAGAGAVEHLHRRRRQGRLRPLLGERRAGDGGHPQRPAGHARADHHQLHPGVPDLRAARHAVRAAARRCRRLRHLHLQPVRRLAAGVLVGAAVHLHLLCGARLGAAAARAGSIRCRRRRPP